MPRQPRKVSKTKIYHVMSRALNKQILFDDESDYLYFLNVLNDTKKELHFEIYAYCLMSNHFHLLIKEKGADISTIMSKIDTKYANYYNNKNGRTGFVFNDRFHSEVVETVKYFLTCIRYIHQNPLKAMICKKTYEYKFSSIHAYRKEKGNYLNLVDTKYIKDKFDINEFIKWNEIDNRDRCMDAANNKMTDNEILKLLYKSMGIKSKQEYLQKSEAEKIYHILKLIDFSIPLKQLSRVTGIYYNKLQKLRIGKEGKTVMLTYKTKN